MLNICLDSLENESSKALRRTRVRGRVLSSSVVSISFALIVVALRGGSFSPGFRVSEEMDGGWTGSVDCVVKRRDGIPEDILIHVMVSSHHYQQHRQRDCIHTSAIVTIITI